MDWTQTYTTVGRRLPAGRQLAFLRNFARGEAYLADAPALWDVTFQTAVAQAELEARDYPGPTTASPSTGPTARRSTSRPPGPS